MLARKIYKINILIKIRVGTTACLEKSLLPSSSHFLVLNLEEIRVDYGSPSLDPIILLHIAVRVSSGNQVIHKTTRY